MKRQVFGLAVLLFVLGAVLANAQSSTVLVTNIPFGFIAGDVALPGGEYSIQFESSNRLMRLTDWKGHDLCFQVRTAGKAVREAKDNLVFHQVNGRYFLTSIWTADNSMDHVLSLSRHEREMLAQGGQPVLRELRAGTR
jgi:hypothetical protein